MSSLSDGFAVHQCLTKLLSVTDVWRVSTGKGVPPSLSQMMVGSGDPVAEQRRVRFDHSATTDMFWGWSTIVEGTVVCVCVCVYVH